MAIVQGAVGKQAAADSSNPNVRQARTGDIVTSDGHGRYYETVSRGDVYRLSVAGATATAFTGGAAGTPLLGIYNPTGSGKNLVVLVVGVSNRVAASAAGTVDFALYQGVSAAPTGTLTTPTNALTQAASGSVALGVVNAAATSTTATALQLPLGSYYWATAAGAINNSVLYEPAGSVVVAPGQFLALGASAALTSATWNASVLWEEVTI